MGPLQRARQRQPFELRQLEPPDKNDLSLDLLRKAFQWAREVNPTQPLTSGAWVGDWSPEKASATAKFQFEQSDIISFHN